MDVYEEFLSLCLFDQDEIKQQKEKLRSVCDEFAITAEQIQEAAEQWIPQNYDLKLDGIRKLLGVYVHEFLDIFNLCQDRKKEMKAIYGTMPSPIPVLLALKENGKEEFYVGTPDIVLLIVLNNLFHWRNSGLTRIEEKGFTSACRHCALNKMRAFIGSSRYIRAPNIIWTWGTACDEAAKTEEFIHCCYNQEWSYVSTKIPHDVCRDEQEDEFYHNRIEYFARQMQECLTIIGNKCDLILSPENLSNALSVWNKLSAKIQVLNTLVCNADPIPLGGNELSLINSLQLVHFNTGMKHAEEAIDLITEEVKHRILNNTGILPLGSPRLACYLVPFCMPWIVSYFEQRGVSLTVSTLLTATFCRKRKVRYCDPYFALAEQWLALPAVNDVFYEAKAIKQILTRYKNQGLLLGGFSSDRWLGAHQKLLRRILEDTIDKPVFTLEVDFWDERFNDEETIKNKTESISGLLEKFKCQEKK